MSFNFNPKIDRDFIISMYEDDYPYISEMFQTTLTQLIPDVELVKKHFENQDLQNLRKQVHKIKPAFGFAGLRETETLCQQFEDSCISVSSTEALTDKYNRLAKTLDESCLIIREEIKNLNAYQN